VNTKNIRVIREIRVQKNICGLLVEHEILLLNTNVPRLRGKGLEDTGFFL
jgi:hypothetical protein